MMRRAGLIVALLLLPSCGLHPLYGGGTDSAAAAVMRSVAVAPIPGHPGWLVRTKLVDRLGQAGEGTATYRLVVTLDDNITSYGLRRDQAATQERRTLRARYQLVNMSNGMVVLDATAGSDTSIDIVSSPYATLAAEQTGLELLANEVADQIVSRLAVYAVRTQQAK